MNTKITYSLAVASLAMLVAAGSAQAQFKLPSLSRSTAAPADASAVSSDTLLNSFVESNKEVLLAQSLLAKAYGLKDQAAVLQNESESLKSDGITSDQITKAVNLSKSASDEIASRQAKQSALSTEEKQYYVASLPHFVKGVVGTRKLVNQALHFDSAMKSSLSGGLGGGMAKLKAGMTVAKSTPAYSKSLFDAFRKTVTIGRKNNVKLPDDATAALSDL